VLPWRSALAVVLALATLSGASGQSNVPGAPTYLMRLVHAQDYENTCVLVRGDGQFHLERQTAQKTDVFEGMLTLPEWQHVEHLVSVNELFDLTEDRVVRAQAEHGAQVILSVHRPGHWQNLSFPAPSSWESYRASVVPLVEWLDEFRKVKNRVKLREEETKNNCLPERKLELKVR
jgi:hypothetical protein